MIYILCVIAIVAFLIGLLDANPNPYNSKDLGKQCITSCNTNKASKTIADWLNRRRWICNFRKGKKPVTVEKEDGWNSTKETHWSDFPGINDVESIYEGNGIQSFIRMSHLLGCSVIIRQVGSEEEEDKKYEQVVTQMRDEYYYRDLF